MATISWDRTVRIWDPDTRQQVGQPFVGHTSRVTGITSLTHHGRTLLATTSNDQTARIWDLDIGVIQRLVAGTPIDDIWADDAGRYLIIGGPDGRMARLDIIDAV